MAFPILGSPKPQFFDSSGNPLGNGTLSVLEPTNDSNKTYYPTADDADAATNGASGDITLNSRGEPTNALFGVSNQKYKCVLKDSSGTTIWTVDDIQFIPGAISFNGTTKLASESTGVQVEGRIDVNQDSDAGVYFIRGAQTWSMYTEDTDGSFRIYDVTNSEPAAILSPNSSWQFNFNGSGVLATASTGISITGSTITLSSKPGTYTPTNVTTDRTYDANATSTDELADILGTLIADLQTIGLIG